MSQSGAASVRSAALAALALLAGAVAWLYWGVVPGLVRQWASDDDYSHGFFVVPLAAFFAWERRDALRRAARRPHVAGAALLAAALLCFVAGQFGSELFLTRVSLIGVLAGLVLFVAGPQHLRILAFPLAFLLLMVPLPALIFNKIAFPLQLIASHVGEYTISSLDIPILREGNVLILANATLEVAEACSGIRSLVSLFTLGIVFGYFVDRRHWVRAVIALSAVPVAILANGLRVASAGVAAHNFGASGVEGLFHDFSGWVVFIIAFLMMLGFQRLLQRLVPPRVPHRGPRDADSASRGGEVPATETASV